MYTSEIISNLREISDELTADYVFYLSMWEDELNGISFGFKDYETNVYETLAKIESLELAIVKLKQI